MRVFLVFLLVSICSIAIAQEAAKPLSQILVKDFAMDELWDDGRAEVATYQASRVIYGQPREYSAHLITVKEDFNTEYYAKADWPYGQAPILPVMKQNFVAQIPTPNYDYHYMRSLFVDRADFSRTVKATFVGFEWCGNNYKEFQFWQDPPIQKYSSYWDGEGTGERKLTSSNNTFLEEELPLLLRALPFEAGLTSYLQVYPNQTTNRAPEPKASRAVMVVTEAKDSWIVNVNTEDGRGMSFQFAAEYPHVLESFEHSDGRQMELSEVKRDAYWEIRD